MISPHKQEMGFTLLELLIVLVLAGLLASLVFPRLDRVWQSINESNQLDDILSQIATLGYRVHLNQQQFTLDKQWATNNSMLQIAQGWSIKADKTIHYRANGICSGGELIIKSARSSYEYTLEAPFCKPMLKKNALK